MQLSLIVSILMSVVSSATPEYLIGRWRMLEVKNRQVGNIDMREVGMLFGEDTLTLLDSKGQQTGPEYKVTGDKYNITIESTKDKT